MSFVWDPFRRVRWKRSRLLTGRKLIIDPTWIFSPRLVCFTRPGSSGPRTCSVQRRVSAGRSRPGSQGADPVPLRHRSLLSRRPGSGEGRPRLFAFDGVVLTVRTQKQKRRDLIRRRVHPQFSLSFSRPGGVATTHDKALSNRRHSGRSVT